MSPDAATEASLAEICIVALAECFRGDGEILANPIGTIPMIAGRLARASFEPDLMVTDGEAALVAGDEAFAWPGGKVVEYSNPYRSMFDIVWSGRRHVIMGATQIDPYGNQNFAAIGTDYSRPKTQLIGFRGAPGNTVNNTTSYWINPHSTRVFVDQVDFVSGVGWDRALGAGTAASEFFDLRRVVTNLATLDFGGPDHRMRLLQVHPGVSVDDVRAATGFELALASPVTSSRRPTVDELTLIRTMIDPDGLRYRELPE
ncbi:MAG: CoA-transferase subunit beta [Acidimicrobiales bacterium]|uniref:CoA-transferase n=1 Tax=Candidatus Aeolococcus gillhamiae TaxID=3127015 RepID=A0A2W6ASQ2_9BACT|nr:MAG: CoA-transferase [Candidatus Dormibacter sp. RRmetagenome_bin12]